MNSMLKRLILEAKNITPSRPDFAVIGIFNPAVAQVGEETILLARVAEKVVQSEPDRFLIPRYSQDGTLEVFGVPKNSPDFDFSDCRLIRNRKTSYLTSLSHLQVCRSRDGIHFTLDPQETIFPETPYEEYGLEDPRITAIDGRFYITYSAISSCGINVGLMVTDDFRRFERLGNIFHSDNKDVAIFPEKIRGKYFALHRPSISHFGSLDVWTAEGDNLRQWGNHKILKPARVTYDESARVGAGAVPLKTEKGWFVLYHSADAQDRYHLTGMLLDLKDPNRVLMKSRRPVLEPTETFETTGFVPNVVFTCGLLPQGDLLRVYYGACDQDIAVCDIPLAKVFADMEAI